MTRARDKQPPIDAPEAKDTQLAKNVKQAMDVQGETDVRGPADDARHATEARAATEAVPETAPPKDEIALETRLEELIGDGVCLAYSGGVDSAYLLAVFDALLRKGVPGRVRAAYFVNSLNPSDESAAAAEFARGLGFSLVELPVDPLVLPEVVENRTDRCYACKRAMFEALRRFADRENCRYIADGTNADDALQYRPGLRALAEAGVVSPLREAGLGKARIRALAARRGLSVARKPSMPCLATRFPYDTRLDPARLARLGRAEARVRTIFGEETPLRLRCRADEALTLEIEASRFEEAIARRERLVSEVEAEGFRTLALDLRGFRSGTMDRERGIR